MKRSVVAALGLAGVAVAVWLLLRGNGEAGPGVAATEKKVGVEAAGGTEVETAPAVVAGPAGAKKPVVRDKAKSEAMRRALVEARTARRAKLAEAARAG